MLWAGSPVTLGEPHNDGQQHTPVLWRKGSVVEGAQASADPDWISCPAPYLRVTLGKLLKLIYKMGGTNKTYLLGPL